MSSAKFKFITGKAGTGKTTLIRKLAAEDPGVLLTASTGIAAINLGDCTTINSTLGYFDLKSLREAYSDSSLDSKIAKLSERLGVRTIAIDEASMLSGDQLDIICHGLDFHNSYSNNPIGLTLVADFAQLAPIKAPYTFEAKEWPRFEANTTQLTKIYRQSDDNFIEALAAAREGNGAEASEYFQGHFNNVVDTEYNGTTIVGTNEEVDRMNSYRLARLTGRSIYFKAEREGKSISEWKNIPDSLEVKINALVMLLSNKYDVNYNSMTDMEDKTLVYANGDLGYFRSRFDETSAMIELIRNKELVRVNYIQRDNVVVNKKGIKVTKGTIKYMPLRVAYASTVYKVQGLTMDRCQINIRHPFFKTPGMVYVALSRCRSMEGIRLVGNEALLIKRCKVADKVVPWL